LPPTAVIEIKNRVGRLAT